MNANKKSHKRPELNPEIMYTIVDDKKYKSELEIIDRWQSFSAELLRLSLLGIAIFGFLYQQVLANFDAAKYSDVPIDSIKWLSKLSVICFAVSTVCALIYRYGSTEAMMHFLRGIKNPSEDEKELISRNWWLSLCLFVKILSAIFLASGTVVAAIVIFQLL